MPRRKQTRTPTLATAKTYYEVRYRGKADKLHILRFSNIADANSAMSELPDATLVVVDDDFWGSVDVATNNQDKGVSNV